MPKRPNLSHPLAISGLVLTVILSSADVVHSSRANTQPGARLMAIVVPEAQPGGACTVAGIPCGGSGNASALVTRAGSAGPEGVFIYVVVAGATNDAAGLAGAQFGIAYDEAENSGIDLHSWTSCAVREYPDGGWPESGSGNTLAWLRDRTYDTTCPRGSQLVLGYFTATVHGPDRFVVKPHPATGLAKVADCTAAETWLDDTALGAAGVGGSSGDDPCARRIGNPRPVPGDGPDTPYDFVGPRLLMHAVPVVDAGACDLAPTSLCTSRAKGQQVQLPAPGGSPDEYWVYVMFHDPYYEATSIYELTVGDLRMEGMTALEWVSCQDADYGVSRGWPAAGTSITFRNFGAAGEKSDHLLGALRVRVSRPGFLRLGEKSRVLHSWTGIRMETTPLFDMSHAARIGVGNVRGHDPCPARPGQLSGGVLDPPPLTSATAVTPSTWSWIKRGVH
jgi:hypothetical protein